MVADALAPCVARPSAAMKLTLNMMKDFSYKCRVSVVEFDRNCKYMFKFLLKDLARK